MSFLIGLAQSNIDSNVFKSIGSAELLLKHTGNERAMLAPYELPLEVPFWQHKPNQYSHAKVNSSDCSLSK